MKPFYRAVTLTFFLIVFGHTGRSEESGEDNSTEELKLYEGMKWNFKRGEEFPPGGKGDFRIEEIMGEKAGVLAYDFSEGGTYVGGLVNINIPGDLEEIRIRVRAQEPQDIAIRVYDSTYQVHGWQCSYTDVGEWQWVRCNLNKPADYHFQGSNDAIYNYPFKAMMLGVVVKKGMAPTGEVQFSKVRVIRK
jgi:hypothetical protein